MTLGKSAIHCTTFTALSCAISFAAHGAEPITPEKELEQLRFEVRQMRIINQNQAKQLQLLENRVLQAGKEKPSRSQQAQTNIPAQPPAAEVKRSADPSRSVEDILQEEHVSFSRDWSVDVGISYTRYDRKQLVLDGFLALDAILLGDVSIDDIESDLFTLDLGARYKVSDRWQLGIRAPFINRSSTYTKTGNDGLNTVNVQASADSGFKIGDVELASYYKLFRETESRPDTVWNLRIKTPTGKEPYGVKNIVKDDGSVRLEYPSELPTGSGLWAVSTGFSFVKTTDPAILFANIDYTHQFAESFDDISSTEGEVQPGEVRLGNSFAYGLGAAFAVNNKMSLSLSVNHRLQGKAQTRAPGGAWQKVIGSDGNAATFNTGVTYAVAPHASVSTTLGIGLTPDAPDFTIGFKVPYSF